MWPEGLGEGEDPRWNNSPWNRGLQNCQILWQRDINAGKNMYDIAEAIWNGGQRPNEFARPERQQRQHIAATNAVSSAS